VVNFSALPPEVISARIHAGPGAESLIEASGAWQRLGSSLEESAGINAGALSSLTEAWQGPSAAAMADSVAPYLSWLHSTAQQCQQIAVAAQDAVAAFSSVRAAVVPVALVKANRVRLAQLWATNQFGINLPAIAETEDEYQGMWANNSAAMSRYLAASAQATTLPLFSSPAAIADPAGLAAQASAMSSVSLATRATASTTAAASSPISSIISAIQGFDPTEGWVGLANVYAYQFVASGFPINLLSYLAQLSAAQSLQAVGGDIGQGLAEGQGALGGVAGGAGTFGAAGLSAEPTAAIGVGVSMGKLTLPPAVVGLLPASQAPVQLASAVTPLTDLDAMDAMDSDFPLPPLMPPPASSAGTGWRKRKQQKYGAYQDPEEDEFEEPADEAEEPPESPGTGWRKRANYDDIELGAELRGTVMKNPPSAG
jgi:PPE-repeat protein